MNRQRRSAKPSSAGASNDQSGTPAPRNYSFQNTPKRTLQQSPVDEKDFEPVVEQQYDPVENVDEPMNVEDANGGEKPSPKKKGKLFFKKIFLNRKKASVRSKEKKVRQNRTLRRVITPKNALMALNEVKGINIGDFVINSNVGGGFSAVVCVNGNQYEGKGSSKIIAKNNACEKALRDYVLAKMRQKPRRGVSRPTSVSGDTAMDTSEENGENGGSHDDDNDEVPMINLTSFALYKLFTEWEKEGYEIPEFHPQNQSNANDSDGGGSIVAKEPKKPAIRHELPPNWESLHPATLLCVMRPGVTYRDLGIEGEKPNALQKLGVVVDEQEFVGMGRNKKIARRNAAVLVCNDLFSTNFELEESNGAAPAAS